LTVRLREDHTAIGSLRPDEATPFARDGTAPSTVGPVTLDDERFVASSIVARSSSLHSIRPTFSASPRWRLAASQVMPWSASELQEVQSLVAQRDAATQERIRDWDRGVGYEVRLQPPGPPPRLTLDPEDRRADSVAQGPPLARFVRLFHWGLDARA